MEPPDLVSGLSLGLQREERDWQHQALSANAEEDTNTWVS